MKRQTSYQVIPASRQNYHEISLNDIVRYSALEFSVSKATLFETPGGRGQLNTARSAAMYIDGEYGGQSLNEIAE